MTTSLSDRYFARGREFLGCKYPFMCGAMSWVSEPRLVSAVCNEGGFGCLAGGNSPVSVLEQQIEQVQEMTDKPFAVNLVTLAPAYREQLELLKRKDVRYVVFAGGFPKEHDLHMMKDQGAKVMCFASTHSIAARMIRWGADAIILEGTEAGGHIGQVTLMVLLQQVLFTTDEVPVFVAGGITEGRMCAHLFMMGAAGVQLATRFAVAHESIAHANFKEAIVRANARHAVATPQFDSRLPVVPVRALKNKGTDDFGHLQLDLLGKLDRGEISREAAQLQVETFWMGALRNAVIDGDVQRGSLMAGQSVGLIKKCESVREIIMDLVNGTESELQRVREKLLP
jgi:enoyl-[acyl-carrier protein] reductase II